MLPRVGLLPLLLSYIECSNLSKNQYGSYDPVAWESGEIHELQHSNGTKTVTIEGAPGKISLPSDALLRKVAVKGEGLCAERGDYDIRELSQYAGVPTAQIYLMHTLYHIYKDETEINMKHFEVLVAAMTMYMVVTTDRKDLKVGQYHDSVQLHKGSLDKTVFVPVIKGVKTVPTSRTQVISRILMEEVKDGLSASVLLGLEDPLEYPLTRIAMGQIIECGGTGEFLEERKI